MVPATTAATRLAIMKFRERVGFSLIGISNLLFL
jgi:hypothetical protein